MSEINSYIDETKTRFKQMIPYVIAIVLLLILLAQCNDSIASKARFLNNKKIANDSLKYYKNKIGTLTASIGNYEMTQQEFEYKILNKDQELKKLTSEFNKLKSITKFTANAHIDTVYIPFSSPVNYDSISHATISEFTRKGNYKKEWFSFDYSLNNSGFSIKNINASADITVITGFKRKWVFGKSYVTTDITSNNPNITITNAQSTEIVVPKKWYQTNAFFVALGFALKSALPPYK